MLAVNVTEPPGQIVVDPLAVMVGVGALPTVSVVGNEVAEHPPNCVTLTV